jgi:uncharacterized protein (DUF427 family)
MNKEHTMNRDVRVPDETHTITIEPSSERVLVEVDGRTVADTANALVLREAGYPAVYYVPLDDVDRGLLHPSDRTTYCPYKGDASHFSIVLPEGKEVSDAVWAYEDPYPAVAEIAGHVAFYPDRVKTSVGTET